MRSMLREIRGQLVTIVEGSPTTVVCVDTRKLDQSLAYSLRRAQLSTYDDFSGSMADFDVRPSQFSTLVLTRANPGMTQSAISNALGIQKANFVGLINSLEKRNLIERKKAKGDRRSSALYLTPAGDLLVRKLEKAHQALEVKLSKRLGKRRSQELLLLLREFCQAQGEANGLGRAERYRESHIACLGKQQKHQGLAYRRTSSQLEKYALR